MNTESPDFSCRINSLSSSFGTEDRIYVEITTYSERETIEVGRRLGELIQPNDAVLLEGPMGSGKTHFAKGIINASTGVDQDEVVSPTFTLINRFEGRVIVDHADFFRLAGHFDTTILDESIESNAALIIEWPEEACDLFADALKVVFAYIECPDARIIGFSYLARGSTWGSRMHGLIRSMKTANGGRME